MNGFFAFLSKELLEMLRTHRIWIVIGVFFLLGLMNAPLANFTPQLLELAGASEMMGDLAITQPTALDAWAQFYANVGQMGVLAILLICGGMLSRERSRDTLVLPLTKGLGRTGIVLVKFLVASMLWTLAVVVATVVSWAYTELLFSGETVKHLFLSVVLFWLFGEFLLALIPLSSVLFKGGLSGLIIPGFVLFVLLVLTAFPDLFFWNPCLLIVNGLGLMDGAIKPSEMLVPALVAVAVAASALVAAIVRFKHAPL
ncbi:MAG: ABC transporter permease subunit [Coriobacteriia bacterium]|nr:ABC transporter permease subunit [Coriobacteriia bacterium]